MNEKSNNDPISKALNLTPIVPSVVNTTSVQTIIQEAHNDSASVDFETARSNIMTVIEDGQQAIFKLSQIAESSQHPRAFEVLAKLMDTVIHANKELLELQTKIRDIQAKDAPHSEQAKTINNNLFVGSTSELQQIINNIKSNNLLENK